MSSYQILHINYPVLVLTILSFILICFYLFLFSLKSKGQVYYHFIFLVLTTLENIIENLYQPTQTFPLNVREATGYMVTAFWPYYVYKLTSFPAYKHYVVHSLFILVPTAFFFFIFYPFFGSFVLARQLNYIIPACYGLYAIPVFFISAQKDYREKKDKQLFLEHIFLMTSIIFWALSPLVRIYMNGSRSAIGLIATTPIILFNVYIIIKELKLLTNAKVNTAKNESSIDLSDYALTPREAEVINLAYQGKTYKEIGKELFISEARVKQIVSNAYRKLGVESKMELIKKMK